METLTKYKLNDLYEIGSGISTKPEQFGHGFPFASFSTIFNNAILPDELPDYMDTSEKQRIASSIREGDVFITRTSETLDELAMSSVALKDYPNATFSGFAKRLRPVKKNITYPRFMAFYFRSPYFRKIINANAVMTLRASFNEDIFSYIDLYLPSFETQKRIGDLFWDIEKKIRINKKINDNLEQIINLLYHHRFFGFVASKDKPIFTGGSFRERLPYGWRICKLKEIAELTMGQSPKSNTYNSKRVGLPLINGAAELQKQGISIEKYTSAPARVCRIGDILFCIRATLGNVQFANREYCLGRGVAALRPKKDIYREYVYLAIRDYLDAVASNLSGSIIVGLSKEDIEDLSIPLPPLEELQSFSKAVSPMVDKIYRNRDEAIQIAKTRDDFFPLFINGQIRIFD